MDSLVSTEWLAARLGTPDIVVLDCTHYAGPSENGGGYKTISGRSNWKRAHIPGSGFADFTRGLAGDDRHYRNSLPDPEKLAVSLSALGVGDTSRVILYDSETSMWAARVWWMLRWIGFDNAAVLDGGLRRWVALGHPVSSRPEERPAGQLVPHLRTSVFATQQDVKAALKDRSAVLIDALSRAQFSGTASDLGLCGHIPGARNIPATELTDNRTGCYLPQERLARILPDDHQARIVVYCGSGIAAAQVAWSLVRVGHEDVTIYMPGLQEWIRDPSAPLVNGPDAPRRGSPQR